MEKNIRILHIDDNRLDRELVRESLDGKDFEIIEATTRNELEEILARGEIDLVLSDFNILGLSGFEVMEIVSYKNPDLPIILITGTGSEMVAVEALKMGAEDYVIKTPDHIRRLPNAIHAVLERRATLKELKTSQERYQELVESTDDLIIQLDREGIILYVNKTAERIFGLKPEESIGRSAFSFIHPDDREEIQKRISERIKSRDTRGSNEFCIISKTGEELYLSWVANYHYDEAGNIINISGIGRDVTTRKKAEKELKENKARLDLSLKASNIGLWDWDLKTNNVYFSPEWKRQIGYEDDEIANTFDMWETRLHPDDHDRVISHVKAYIDGSKPDYATEFRFLHKNGSYRWIYVRGEILSDEDGNPSSMLGCHIDITDRKQAEEAFASEKRFSDEIINSLPGVFYLYDDEQRLVRWNKRAEEVSGYSSEELLHMHPLDFHDTENKIIIEKALKNLFIEGTAQIEASVLTKDGENTPYYLTGSLIMIEGRTYFLGVGIDVAERKRAEEALKAIAQTFAHYFDRELYENVSAQLAKTLGADYAFVGQRIDGQERIKVMGGYGKGEPLEPFEYDLAGTPCANVMEQSLCIYPSGVQKQFPEDSLLVDMNIEGYLGSILLDHNGNRSGLLVVLHSKPIEDTGIAKDLFAIFSGRLSAELARNKTLLKLSENEEKYRSLITNIPDVTWTTDQEGITSFISPNIEKIYGYTPEEIYRNRLNLWLDRIHPDDIEHLANALKEAFEKGSALDVEYRIKRKDGEWIWLHDRSIGTYEKDGVKYADGIFTDITLRKKADEELNKWAQVFEHAQWGISISNPDTKCFELTNRAYARMHGYTVEELRGTPISDLYAPEFLAELSRNIDIIGKEGHITFESIRIRKDGSTFPSLIDAIMIKDVKGDAQHFVANIIDLTDRKQADKERIRLESQLQQAQKMEAIGTLAGGIAHDFNNILTSVIGYSELALDNIPENSETFSFIQTVHGAGKRARDLVQQILAFSRDSEQELRPIKVQLVIKEALKLLRASIPTTIEIEQNINPDCSPVLADPTQIHQVIMNLCTNAYHAMRETGGIMCVVLEPVELPAVELAQNTKLQPGRYLRIEVSDNGCGISKFIQERIFEPYFTTKDKGEGTGLGLSVVYGIVKSFNGDITVYSEPGEGTTFNVYLPVMEDIKPPPTDEEQENELLPGGNERILFVDDEESIVNLSRRTFESLGYSVTALTSSMKTLAIFKESPGNFDLLITDMTMPEINGAELAKQVLAIRPDMPIIICSGYSYLVDPQKAKALGVKDYIMKPVIKKDIARIVRKVLDEKG